MTSLKSLVSAAILGSVLVSNAFADGRKAGSLLIFPVHRSGNAFTLLSVTNTNLTPMTRVSFGGSTNVHYQYVNVVPNRANPFRPLNCSIYDRVEFLTPADTLCVLTACHNATFGTQEGFVVVNAEDPSLFRQPWSHNYLIGSECVISASGVIYSTEALPFSSPVAAGAATDVNNNRRLDFDGVEYEKIPDLLYIDSFIALAGSQLSLMNLTGHHTDINTIYFSVWNDNEYPMSATLEFNCWFDQPLTHISSLFSEDFLVRTPNDPRELDLNCDGRGDLETGWAILDSIDVRTAGGLPVSPDGAVLGSITVGSTRAIDGGRLLWESRDQQANGSFSY
jgi:hypothetical protein